MSFTKNITIQANDLQGPSGLNEIYIILGFDQDAIRTAQTPFSDAAWKVAPFYPNKPGYQHMEATYVGNLGVSKSVDDGQAIKPAIDTAINVGQQIDLINNKDPQFYGFVDDNQISDDSEIVTIGAGTYGDNGKVNPISARQDVGNGASVDVQFVPIISIYSSANYVQSKLFPGHINSLLWYHDLADVNLPNALVFDLAWNAGSSEFVLSLEG